MAAHRGENSQAHRTDTSVSQARDPVSPSEKKHLGPQGRDALFHRETKLVPQKKDSISPTGKSAHYSKESISQSLREETSSSEMPLDGSRVKTMGSGSNSIKAFSEHTTTQN